MPYCIGWVENFDEIALSRTVKEIVANVFCPFWQRFKMVAIFGEGKIFFENCQEYIAQVRKFKMWGAVENVNKNRSILHIFGEGKFLLLRR